MSSTQKWKRSERKLGKWLIENDGPDPRLPPGGGIVSSTGRVGHITALQYDAHSLTYCGENKNAKVPRTLWNFWLKVVGVAIENGKEPLIRYEPTNEEKFVKGVRIPNLHIITEERHAELLSYERLYRQAQEKVTIGYSKEEQLRRGRGKRR